MIKIAFNRNSPSEILTKCVLGIRQIEAPCFQSTVKEKPLRSSRIKVYKYPTAFSQHSSF